DDGSGTLRYVSVRHAGASVTPGVEISGITFAGVGRNTTVEYVEAFACVDDGIAFFGGAVNTKYLVSAYSQDDAFDIDLGYVGLGQHWFGLSTDGNVSFGIEWDGARPDDNPIYSNPILSNVTLIGPSSIRSELEGVYMRDGTAGTLSNSIISSFTGIGLRLEALPQGISAYGRLLDGEITINNNIWTDFQNSNDPSNFLIVEGGRGSELDSLIKHFNDNNNEAIDPQLRSICYDINNCLDPRPQVGSPALSGASIPNDPFFDLVDHRGAFGSTNWLSIWSALDINPFSSSCAALTEGTITVQIDGNNDCAPDVGEQGAANWIIEIRTPDDSYFVKTNDNGEYNGFIPTTATEATVQPINSYWGVCVPSLPLENIGQDTVNAAFAVAPLVECPLMWVDLSAPFLRRCFDSNYIIRYCNNGTIAADDVRVELALDTALTFNRASIPHTVVGDKYVFDIGTVEAGECGTFSVNVDISCTSEFGQTHCSTAHIFPDSTCNPPLAAAKLETEVNCDGNNVSFLIRNVSNINMTEYVPYIVTEDHVMRTDIGDNIRLNANQSIEVRLAANGSTFHLHTANYPEFPELGLNITGIEGCGTNSSGSFSTGFLTGFQLESIDLPSVSIDCQPNIGSFDPNDKAANPTGILAENYIRANTDIEYKIRFQNTGTDTAFTVVIIDTLSEQLDISSLEVGTASHDYIWELNDRALIFTFNNILLPDSNVNEPASHGFVKFKIAQQADLPDFTEITNLADIYFDFNDPIRTNEVFHTIGQPYQVDPLVNVLELYPNAERIKVFPNPFATTTTIDLEGRYLTDGRLRVFDLTGRLQLDQAFSGDQILFHSKSLGSGLYFFQIEGANELIGSGKLMIE
ncbi:MAG: T9SS type A sorting domain-containing protein, partial [Bacteroidota bacterium]